MPVDQNNLIWIDMEMTGLQPDSDRIIEIALLVTDAQLATVAEGPVMVIHQPGEVLDAMDAWNKATHAKTGLIERVRSSRLTEAQAQRSERPMWPPWGLTQTSFGSPCFMSRYRSAIGCWLSRSPLTRSIGADARSSMPRASRERRGP